MREREYASQSSEMGPFLETWVVKDRSLDYVLGGGQNLDRQLVRGGDALNLTCESGTKRPSSSVLLLQGVA